MILTHTISAPELIWTVWCSAGLLFLLKLLRDAVVDWRWVIKSGHNSVREYAAINSVLVYTTMTLTELVFVIAGIVAMMIPPPVQQTVSPLTYTLTGLFITASAGKTIMAVIISIRKETLTEKIESGEWVVTKRD